MYTVQNHVIEGCKLGPLLLNICKFWHFCFMIHLILARVVIHG